MSQKSVIYCRKSTSRKDMQEQSLDIQLEWCEKYAKDNKLQVVDTIIESASASKIDNRDGFNSLVDIIESGKADTLIVYRIDRIARNPIDEGYIKHLAQQA